MKNAPLKKSRRSFLKKLGAAAAAAAGAPFLLGAARPRRNVRILELAAEPARRVAPNDRIRIACIGTGGMGMGDVDTALKVGGVEIVAACDLYDGRLARAREKWGQDLFTTRDYHEILAREDVDAILCATSDHWHEAVSVAALRAGKAVYCEKPMVRTVEEGHRLLRAEQETGRLFQVGSQYVSGLVPTKARALFEAGEIGALNFVEAMFDRHSPLGAWQYSIPLDASEETIDWQRYTANTTRRPFDAKRFFRWRNYLDYGTGVAGDLFVHLLSELHYITGAHGPTAVASSGGLRYFKDGREVPDIQIGLFDYPETKHHPPFNLVLRANFVDGSGGQYLFRLVGDEGEIRVGWDTVKVTRRPWPKAPGKAIDSFSEEGRKAFEQWYDAAHPAHYEMEGPASIEYRTPKNYPGDRHLHLRNFFASLRDGTPSVEDATFGLRAAGPTLAGNQSYFEKRVVDWDPERMRITTRL